jgi:hypothetical protein
VIDYCSQTSARILNAAGVLAICDSVENFGPVARVAGANADWHSCTEPICFLVPLKQLTEFSRRNSCHCAFGESRFGSEGCFSSAAGWHCPPGPQDGAYLEALVGGILAGALDHSVNAHTL